jgi:uncharacterized RDD family membrane protein YckC
MVYEGVLLFGVVFLADYLFDAITQSRSGLMNRHSRQLWLFLVLGVYFTWFWTHSGQTLAMKTWHVRVVDASGKGLQLPQAVFRYVLCWIFILPTLALLELTRAPFWLTSLGITLAFVLPPFFSKFDPQGQFLHDRLAGTRLVSRS